MHVAVDGFNVPPAPADSNTRQGDLVAPGGTPPAAPAQNPPPVPGQPPAPAAAPTPAQTQVDPGYQALLAQMIADAAAKAKAAPVPAAAPAAADAPSLNGFDVNTIEDPQLKGLAGLFMQSATNMDIDKALGKAVQSGNVADIDLAYLYSVDPKAAPHLAELAKAIVSRVGEQGRATVEAVYQLAGGEQGWNAAVAAFNAHAPAHIVEVVGALVNSGVQAKATAGAQMVMDFAKASGAIPQNGQFLNTGAAAPGGAGALDANGFKAELAKLDRNSVSYEQDRGALFERRQAGKNMGL